KFHLQSDGDIVVKKVSAVEGTIGGFTIAENVITGSGGIIVSADRSTTGGNDYTKRTEMHPDKLIYRTFVSKHYGVHITATKEKERKIYCKCIEKLGIEIKHYKNYKELLISKRKNNIQLLKQRLMCLSPKKYNKFLNMIKNYKDLSTNKTIPWNKIPQETINKIIEIKQQNPSISCKKAAKEIGVSPIKINRVWKQNNLGERLVKTSLKTISNILKLCIIYPYVSSHQIAEKCQVHKGVVHRARKKYNIQKFYKPYSKESFSIKTFNFV
ncbi:hypothetical protein CL616_04575, partial [archaeon]|nr:hypothetical protein [archaeon]